MLFETLDYQQQCVYNIITILQQSDFFDDNFDPKNFQNVLKKHKPNAPYIEKSSNKNRLDVLMETGTGKTFTYLNTIFEINRHFGKTHFMIVLPRTAIKQGVLQTIKHTADYFHGAYKKHIEVIDLQQHSKNKETAMANRIANFLNNDTQIKVIVTNNATFNKKDNIINRIPTQGTFGIKGTYWDNIKRTNPITIIDEPHLLKGNKTSDKLNELKHSLFIRFGATFPTDKKDAEHHLSNVAYTLNSYQAFTQHLVKGVRVHTVADESDYYIMKTLRTSTKTYKGLAEIHYLRNNSPHKVNISVGEDMGAKTNISNLHGIKVNRITADKIYLSNQSVVQTHTKKLSDTQIELAIQKAIDLHFEKEQMYFVKGIKSLSLFFISNISDYKGENPHIKNTFNHLYRIKRAEILNTTTDIKYKKYLQSDIDEKGDLIVSGGYFSGSKGSRDEQEKIGVNAILNDKEKLLSLSGECGNLRFLFSVWALQEGWDNPNVFTLCKLAPSEKETSQRQQVGRGLRIAVDKNGNRLTLNKFKDDSNYFYETNTLDVVVSQHETDFIYRLQMEINNSSIDAVNTDTCMLDDLKDLGLSDMASAMLYSALTTHKIIDTHGKILSPIADFVKHTDIMGINAQDKNKIIEAYSKKQANVTDGNKQQKLIKIRANKYAQFKDLWEKINTHAKIVYQDFDNKTLINSIVQQFSKIEIRPKQIKIHSQRYDAQKDEVINESSQSFGDKKYFTQGNYQDFIRDISDIFDTQTSLSVIPLDFICQLVNNLDKDKICNDPTQAKKELRNIIIDQTHKHMLQNITYDMTENIFVGKENVLNTTKIKSKLLGQYTSQDTPSNQLLYDTIAYDSQIEKDAQTNHDTLSVNNTSVTVFAKLPKLNIPTPFKTYNPDFAYLINFDNSQKSLFLVVETKGYNTQSDIRDSELKKIDYAKKFFTALHTKLQHDNIQVKFVSRINKQSLSDIISHITKQG